MSCGRLFYAVGPATTQSDGRTCRVESVSWAKPSVNCSSQRYPRSSERNLLHVPGHRLSTYGRRAFATAGPCAWNSLPDPIRNPNSTEAAFRPLLHVKSFLIARYECTSAFKGFSGDALYKSTHWYWHWHWAPRWSWIVSLCWRYCIKPSHSHTWTWLRTEEEYDYRWLKRHYRSKYFRRKLEWTSEYS